MLGFRFPENFNFPYISRSITEFWQRWHITLSTWFRDYLYFPLGGSRKGNLITYRNLFVVFVTCGLWHGASWNFLIWGLSHGVFMVLEKVPVLQRLGRLPRFFHHLYMLVTFNFTMAIFRAETIPGAIEFLEALSGFAPNPTTWHTIRELMQNNLLVIFVVAIVFSTPVVKNSINYFKNIFAHHNNGLQLSYLLVLFVLFVLSAMSLASGTYNPFIYFRF
jgi:alginate O-acetyltransferase complex protein AlgI